MNVTACLQPAKLARLKGAAGGSHKVHVALDWTHAEAILHRHPVDVLVVDPQFESASDPQAERIRQVRRRHRALPMIVYSTLAAQTLRPIVELGRDGIEQLVLYGLDDDPERLRDLLARQPGAALASRLLTLVQHQLQRTPPALGVAFEHLFRTPSAFERGSDLAVAAGVPRRTLYRQCLRAGLASPRELLCASRLLRAYALLRGPDYGIALIARTTRLGNAERFTAAMRWAVGSTPARVRERVGPEEFVACIARRVFPRQPTPEGGREGRDPWGRFDG